MSGRYRWSKSQSSGLVVMDLNVSHPAASTGLGKTTVDKKKKYHMWWRGVYKRPKGKSKRLLQS
jgi:hypothetical protein